MKSKLQKIGLFAVVAVLALYLTGCGSAEQQSETTIDQRAKEATSQSKELDFNLSNYSYLGVGECAIVFADGTTKKYEGTSLTEDGLTKFHDQVEADAKNPASLESQYKDAVLVCKGVITAIEKERSGYNYTIGIAVKYSVLGDKVVYPTVTIETTKDKILELGLDVQETVLAVGKLDCEYMTSSSSESGFARDILLRNPTKIEKQS